VYDKLYIILYELMNVWIIYKNENGNSNALL
jgi:hypothetical protein